MAYADSMDKVVGTYFAAVSTIPFAYKKKIYQPKPLYIAPSFLHEFRCVLHCGGCCPRFSLDYLPTDPRPEHITETRVVEVNGVEVELYSYRQWPIRNAAPRWPSAHCDHLNMQDASCTIHGKQPFSCDFETLRFVHFSDHTWLGTRPFGRGWNMLRVDGQRGARCEFSHKPTVAAKEDALRKLRRLKEWTDAFRIPTRLDDVLAWVSGIDPEKMDNHLPVVFYPFHPLERT